MSVPTVADERRHEAGPERLWNESWYLDWFDTDGRTGGYVRLGVCPNLGHAWFWCALVGQGEPPVLVVDQETPIPAGPGLEVRSSGLWADLIVEGPLEHFSVEVEAFGVALDEPADAYRGMRGERLPVGVDLGWETDGPSEGVEPWAFHYDFTTRYEIPCRVAGEVRIGDRRITVDGWGQRDHSWAERDWWATGWTWFSGRLEDGERFHAVALEGRDEGIGYRSTPTGLVVEYGVSSTPELGEMGIPVGGQVTLGGLCFDLDPVGWAPVLLVDPDDGRLSRFPRGLVAVTTSDGRQGHAWVEYNQPQA